MNAEHAAGSDGPPQGALYVVYELERRAYPLGEAFTIGRDTGSDLVVLEPTVSRTHARIVCEGLACRVENVGATGTRVNGLPVEAPLELNEGDRLEIGTAVLTVRRSPLPIGVSVVDRIRSTVTDQITARRPTIRNPILSGPITEQRTRVSRWVLVMAVIVLAMVLMRACVTG